jgi:hypothetical protein
MAAPVVLAAPKPAPARRSSDDADARQPVRRCRSSRSLLQPSMQLPATAAQRRVRRQLQPSDRPTAAAAKYYPKPVGKPAATTKAIKIASSCRMNCSCVGKHDAKASAQPCTSGTTRGQSQPLMNAPTPAPVAPGPEAARTNLKENDEIRSSPPTADVRLIRLWRDLSPSSCSACCGWRRS